MKTAIFWFRRDLRFTDNTALFNALNSGFQVLPIFIFDQNILHELPKNDARFNFIYYTLQNINIELKKTGSVILCLQGEPIKIWNELISKYNISGVFCNKDYEPYAITRDHYVKDLLLKKGIAWHAFKDQVIFEENEVLKADNLPYTVFTPYKNKWLSEFAKHKVLPVKTISFENFYKSNFTFPSLAEIGFEKSDIKVKNYNLSQIINYKSTCDFPAMDKGSYLSPHLRFGTVGIREIIAQLKDTDEAFLSELIWREFFMQILFHFPKVQNNNFKSKYDFIAWRNNEHEFKLWCEGKTGYPLVDAGMRQLNATGYMHNRVRMITAGFLCKHLLIDWRWGEAYFAQKLLDYELSSNNGNWQWSAGTGCDAAPYFRVFNPEIQLTKFDKQLKYIKQWIPEYGTTNYPKPIVEHAFARNRALEVYKKGFDVKRI